MEKTYKYFVGDCRCNKLLPLGLSANFILDFSEVTYQSTSPFHPKKKENCFANLRTALEKLQCVVN